MTKATLFLLSLTLLYPIASHAEKNTFNDAKKLGQTEAGNLMQGFHQTNFGDATFNTASDIPKHASKKLLGFLPFFQEKKQEQSMGMQDNTLEDEQAPSMGLKNPEK